MTDHVTTIVKEVLNPGEGLLRWAWKQGAQGISLDDRTVRDQGVAVHELFEQWVKTGRPPNVRALPVAQRSRAERMIEWREREQPEIALVEERVEHDGVSGRIDFVRLCSCDRAGGLHVRVGDFKTKPPTREAHLQVGGFYPWLLFHDTGTLACGGEIVCLADGKVYEARGTVEAARTALAHYRWIQSLSTPNMKDVPF